MRIFPKTFLYTLALLVLIALLANGLIYTLMPSVYIKHKQQTLNAQAEHLVHQLESAKRENIVGLMGISAAPGQTNIVVDIGDETYSLIMWSNSAGPDDTVTTTVIVTSDATTEDTYRVAEAYAENNAQTIGVQRSFMMAGETGSLTISMTLAPVQEAVNVIVCHCPDQYKSGVSSGAQNACTHLRGNDNNTNHFDIRASICNC